MIMAITVVRDVTPYSLVDIYRSLRRHIPENSNFYVRAQSSCEKWILALSRLSVRPSVRLHMEQRDTYLRIFVKFHIFCLNTY
jgi:hypothetical protein